MNHRKAAANFCTIVVTFGLAGELILLSNPCLQGCHLCKPEPVAQLHVATEVNTITFPITHKLKLGEKMTVVDGAPSFGSRDPRRRGLPSRLEKADCGPAGVS